MKAKLHRMYLVPGTDDVTTKLEEGLPPAGWQFQCPGCKRIHSVYVEHPNVLGLTWQFNGNESSPTFRPSLMLSDPVSKKVFCHSVITDGQAAFDGGNPHTGAGKTLPIPEIEWL
jgi:hypothetical protein